ncbi:MAG TPA: cell wall hydrolase [Desulfosporosinus sp.]|nr:cell wall hydrolase [Desulfosporosinus sp.]
MCLFLWQASFFPALGQESDNASDHQINGTVKIVLLHGETLWGIAKSHDTTVDEIVKLNNVKSPNKIQEGQSLWVPNAVIKTRPQNEEAIIVSTNTANPLPTILTYEIFVNKEPQEPHVNNTTLAYIDAVKTPNVINTADLGAEPQILSRSLGRLVTKEDLETLTRVIHGEARGEDFEGQVAVGAVVLNRVKDSRFPKTIYGVVYQSGAFSAVQDKQIQLDPNDQSYKAAEAALSGVDPTNGALFYFNPRIATDNWIKSRAVVKRIGNHTFSI